MDHSKKKQMERPAVILVALWSFVVTTGLICFAAILLVSAYGVAVYELLQSIMDVAEYLK